MVKPIDDALTRLEGDGSIGVVLKVFTQIPTHSDCQEFYALDNRYLGNVAALTSFFPTVIPKIQNSLKERWNLITDEVFAASFILDPRWRDIAMVQADWIDGIGVIKKMAGDNWAVVHPQLYSFRRKQGGLFSDVVGPSESPTIMWEGARNVGTHKILSEIALYLLTFPMSGVSVERSFSVVRHIHTWKRNRLSNDSLAKLTSVRINRSWEEKTFAN